MNALAGPGFEPFAIAALTMAGLVGVEILSMLVGVSLSEFMGKEIDLTRGSGDADHGLLAGALSFVNPSGVPMLILIIVALAAFSAIGYALQSLASAIAAPLPASVAALGAVLAALPATRAATRAVARIVPRDETYAVSDDDLVGRVGEVTLGPLDQGAPGRVKVHDRFGNWHFPRARAARDAAPIPVGAQVLLVDRDGDAFTAIPAPDDLKAPPSDGR